MDKSQILLKLVADKVKINLDEMKQYPTRFKLQKRVYLAQLSGVDLGYRYNYYQRGPYCPKLASDTFALKDDLCSEKIVEKLEYRDYSLAPFAEEGIKRVSSLWEDTPEGCDDNWLELLTSLHYLRHIAFWPKDTSIDFDKVFERLVESKSQFNDEKDLAKKAWDQLNRIGLIENKTLP